MRDPFGVNRAFVTIHRRRRLLHGETSVAVRTQ
jgi:hypothetical protein